MKILQFPITKFVFPPTQCLLTKIVIFWKFQILQLLPNCDFFYNDGSRLATYLPAFEWIRVDSENLRVDIRLCSEFLETEFSSENIYLEMISIYLKNSELLHRLKKVFALDKMIFADEIFE